MKRFTTETGSIYEVDETNKKIRRLSGNKDATGRQGDGDWKSYQGLVLKLNESALIFWTDEVKPFIKGAIPATETSYVVSITESDSEQGWTIVTP